MVEVRARRRTMVLDDKGGDKILIAPRRVLPGRILPFSSFTLKEGGEARQVEAEEEERKKERVREREREREEED